MHKVGNTIGLKLFKEKFSPISHYYELWPSSLNAASYMQICSMLKCVPFAPKSLPGYLTPGPVETSKINGWDQTTKPTQLSLGATKQHQTLLEVQCDHLEKIMVQSEKIASTRVAAMPNSNVPEMHQKAVVLHTLAVARTLLDYQLLSHGFINSGVILPQYFECVGIEYFYQNNTTFLINGRVDTAIFNESPMPQIAEVLMQQSVPSEHLRLLFQAKKDVEKLMQMNQWPSNKNPHKFGNLPIPTSGFGDDATYPFMSVVVDEKSVKASLNAAQMAANLYANIVSSARRTGLDQPCCGVGIVSNGYRWMFMAMQINTLDLSYSEENSVYNSLWMHEEELFSQDFLFDSSRKINTKVIEILYHMYLMAYVQSKSKLQVLE